MTALMEPKKKVAEKPFVARTVFLLAIKDVKRSPWNPPSRIEEKRLRGLVESIEDVGLLYPILVGEGNRLIDGHRRLAAAIKLGWKHIQAIKIDTEFEHTYGSIQSSQDKLRGNDLLHIYLANPKALIARQRARFETIEKLCGRESLEKIHKAGLTAFIFDVSMRAVRYMDGKITVREVLNWAIKFSMTRHLRNLLDNEVPVASLRKAISENKPIKIKLTSAD